MNQSNTDCKVQNSPLFEATLPTLVIISYDNELYPKYQVIKSTIM